MGSEVETHVEPLDQGLVTAKDQALLAPGELAKADGCIYRPNDPSIQKAKGRTVYNSTPITGAPDVKGLRHLAFDDADSILVAHTGTTYWSSPMSGETGSFSSLATSVGSGATLEAVQYNNRHYLLNGAGTVNVVVKSDLTTRNHGLFAVASPPTLSTASGSWNATLGLGYYFFFTVELINPGPDSTDEIESTNTARDDDIPSHQVTSGNVSTTAVVVTRPTQVNASATHWAVYVSIPQEANKPCPPRTSFARMGSPQSILNTTVTIGNTQLAGTNNSFPTTNSIVALGGWTTPNNAHTTNSSGATAVTRGVATLWRTFQTSGVAMAISGTIQGIEVRVRLRHNSTADSTHRPVVRVSLTKDAGVTYSAFQDLTVGRISGTLHQIIQQMLQWNTFIYGGTNGLWSGPDGIGGAWAAADFNTASFGVKISLEGSSANTATVEIDSIQVSVHTTGTSATTQIFRGNDFPTVVISVGGIVGAIGANGPPPIATTGDIYEDQLVTNDVSDPSIVRYSLPAAVDYFPNLYFINFETKQTDEVTKIIRVGDKLLVGMKNQLFRVNYLPRESDAEYDRGRCYEAISEGHGIVGSQAATVFTVPGGPLMLAFVSYTGLHITDGFQAETLSDDLDWPGTVDLPTAADPVDYLKNCILVDYPNNYWLVLYYTAPGTTTNTKALVFHYHPSHRKPNGKFKVTGPLTVSGLSATVGKVNDYPVLLTGQSGGIVYVEDRGYTHNAGGTLAVDLRTREIYPAHMVNSATLENLYIKHNQDATSTVTVTLLLREGNGAQTTFAQTETFTTANAGVVSIPFHVYSESFQVKLTEPGADAGAGMRIAAVMADYASRGGAE